MELIGALCSVIINLCQKHLHVQINTACTKTKSTCSEVDIYFFKTRVRSFVC